MLRRFLMTSFLILGAFAPALAQETMPAASLEKLPPLDSRALDDGAPIRLTPDGPAVINLDRDAATVIVGNPSHATATMENPRMIMLMPLAPGATKIIALDRDGKAILSRHVLVGGGKSGFMRINRVCAVGQSQGCLPQSVYYCPDKCYETTINSENTPGNGGGGAMIAPVADSPTPAAPDADAAAVSTPELTQ